MAFFDLHCHPFTKPVWMQGTPEELLSGNITTEIDPDFKRGICTQILRIFGKSQIRFFDSQSSLKQIRQGDGQIIVASLVAMENAYANLGFCIFQNVFQRIKNVKREQLIKLGESKTSYGDITNLERLLAVDFAPVTLPGGIRYRIVNSFNEIQEDGVINVILSIEGAHCFYTMPSVNEQERPENRGKVIDALADWKKGTKAGTHPRLLYITLTHHTTNCLTNHAFAVPPGLAGKGTNADAGGFNPGGNSITSTGQQFIRRALSNENGEKPILIDIKHMSIKARLQFYQMRKDMIAAGHPPFPILATHMGVTGLGLNDAIIANCYRFPGDSNCYEVEYQNTERLHGFGVTSEAEGLEILRFYPWSINLFDEEITEIVQSGGLIGFSFDSRILGNENIDRERFGKRETNAIPSISQINFNARISLPNSEVGFQFVNREFGDNQTFGQSRYPEQPFFHLPFVSSNEVKRHTDLMALCQNIIHAVRAGGPQTWDCICIGSDYDGLINSLDFTPDASAIPNMKDRFELFLTRMLTALNAFIDQQGNNEPKLVAPADFYEKFTITNAQRFLQNHFS